jgi:hypothetical protein
MILALDWRKAFDSIDLDAMVAALRRFGLPEHVLETVRTIYKDRRFTVKDGGIMSGLREQHAAGISQGCPLSPFLFVMIMSVLMEDAKFELPQADVEQLRRGALAELLYADDTLLLSVNAKSLERFLAAVSKAGARYGMELHWGKLHLLQVRCREAVKRPDGSKIQAESQMEYLGTTVCEDGRVSRELSRRLGIAHADFRALVRLWRHTSVNQKRKLGIFHALIVSRLLYSLASAWLNTEERRRIDGFQNRCLRTIAKIPSAYLSVAG